MKRYLLTVLALFSICLSSSDLLAQQDKAAAQSERKGSWQAALFLGGGYDTRQTTNPVKEDYIFLEGGYWLDLSDPITARLSIGYEFKQRLVLSSGFGATFRHFRRSKEFRGPNENLRLNYILYSIPLDLSYRFPAKDKFAFELGIGASLEWSGEFENFNFFDGVDRLEGNFVRYRVNEDSDGQRVLHVADSGMSLYRKVFAGLQYNANDKISIAARLAFNFSDSTNGRVGRASIARYEGANEIDLDDSYDTERFVFKSFLFDVGIAYTLGN